MTDQTTERRSVVNINDLTIGQAKELAAMFGTQGAVSSATDASAWEIGKTYLIRTVTMIDTGRLVAVTNQELILEDAAWIADDGRFANALEAGTFSEVEPYPGACLISIGAVLDLSEWLHGLPRTQK